MESPSHGHPTKKTKSDLMEKISVDNKNKSVIVNLNTKIYPSEFVMRAAHSFSESCWINIESDSENSMKLSLKPKSDDIDLNILGYEFVNFVLGVIKNKDSESEGTNINPI